MLGKNGIQVFDHFFPQKLTLTFLGDHSLTPCIKYNCKNNCVVIFVHLIHICKCNAKVDQIGVHGLSCSKSSGRFSRHTEINCIINRSLSSIHVNSTLEPNGLSRDDGKRPNGMTLLPWIKGRPLVWDVTVVDTLADSYVLKRSEVSSFAAEMACKRKHSKYSSIISSNYIFKGLAFETLGAKKPSISLMSSETDLSRNQAVQNQRNSFLIGFPLPFNVGTLQCKHLGHFSRFRIIFGNFRIVNQKCL
jgi:hypothetical protein